jgi:hypothetical protein
MLTDKRSGVCALDEAHLAKVDAGVADGVARAMIAKRTES